MFDLDAGKLIIVGVAALVFIPSKDLPRVLRQAGQFVGKMKRMANDFQGQFMDAMREADMADLRKEAQKLADAARVESVLGTHGRDLEQRLSATPTSPSRVDLMQSLNRDGPEPKEPGSSEVHAATQVLPPESGAGPQHRFAGSDEREGLAPHGPDDGSMRDERRDDAAARV